MYWFDGATAASLAAQHPRVIDASDSAFGGDLQRAVDVLVDLGTRDANGGVVYIPPGCTVHVYHPPLVIATGHKARRVRVRILGGGPSSVVTVGDKASFLPGSALIEVRAYLAGAANGGLTPPTDWALEGFSIDGKGAPGLVGLRLHQAREMIRVRDLWIHDCQEAGVAIDGDSNLNLFEGLAIERCGYGVHFGRAPRWEEYRKDLLFFDGGVKRGICDATALGGDAPYLACGRDGFRAVAGEDCCLRNPGAPDVGCWRDIQQYECVGRLARPQSDGALPADVWWVRHGNAPKSADPLSNRPGPAHSSGNGTTIASCEVADCTFDGIRLGGGSAVRVVNTVVRDCGGHGLSAPHSDGLRLECCSFEGNRGTGRAVLDERRILTPRVTRDWGSDSDRAAYGAQVVLGDSRDDPAPDVVVPPGVGTTVTRGASLVGCRFVLPDGPPPASQAQTAGPKGLFLDSVRRCLVMGCLFQGGTWGVYAGLQARNSVLMGNVFDGTQVTVEDRPGDTENYDAVLSD